MNRRAALMALTMLMGGRKLIGCDPPGGLERTDGLLYLIDNASRSAGAAASIVDRSPNRRVLTTSATSTQRPSLYPRTWELNGQPTIGFDASQSQRAFDATASYARPLHKLGTYFYGAFQVRQSAGGEEQLAGTSGGATNDEDAVSIGYDGSTGKVAFRLHKAGAAPLITYQTAADFIRPGDVFDLTVLVNADKTWSALCRRVANSARAAATTSNSGSFAGTPNDADPAYGFTLGTRGSIGGVFSSNRMWTVMAGLQSSRTAADLERARALFDLRARVRLIGYDQTAIGIYPDDFADPKHWGDPLHLKGATAEIAATQALGTALGWTGQKRRGRIGDSRFARTGASVAGSTDIAALVAAHSFSGFTAIDVGPVDDSLPGAPYFARSGYTDQSFGVQVGHSQLAPHASSINVYADHVTGTIRNVDLWPDCCGINEIASTNKDALDWMDARVRRVEYVIYERQRYDGVTPAVIWFEEPVTGDTTNGPEQYLIRGTNLGGHAAVSYLKSIAPVQFIQTNDTTYNP